MKSLFITEEMLIITREDYLARYDCSSLRFKILTALENDAVAGFDICKNTVFRQCE